MFTVIYVVSTFAKGLLIAFCSSANVLDVLKPALAQLVELL